MENKEKNILNEEQLKEANGGLLLKHRVATNDDELDSVCGGAGKRCNFKADEGQLGVL